MEYVTLRIGLMVLWLAVSLQLSVQTVDAKPGQYSIRFKDDLGIPLDLKLKNNQNSTTVRFNCESTWKPTGGALHLFIEHSPDFDGSRSFLSVTLNYGILRSLRLDESNARRTEVIIPLPAAMLRPENDLVFAVQQYSARESIPVATTIKPDSYIVVQFEETKPALDLKYLPSPLVDPYSYRQNRISVVQPIRPTSETIEATALLIANFANRSAEPIEVRTVRSIDEATGSVLIVGSPKEQPQLKSVASALPQIIREGEGIIALTSGRGSAFTPILIVTATGPEGIVKAAHALVQRTFRPSGTLARISEDTRLIGRQPREWKDHIPRKNHFTLEDINLRELKVGSEDDPLTVRLDTTPDVKFLNYGHTATLKFGLTSNKVIQGSRINIHLNESLLKSVDASELAGESGLNVDLRIPRKLLRQHNVLRIAWQGSNHESVEPGFWLLPSSEFDLPRDYTAKVPDLGLLRSGFFPLGLRSDLSDSVILLPDKGGEEAIPALLDLASRLGRLQPSDRLLFRVCRTSELRAEEKTSFNLISLEVGDLPRSNAARGASAMVQESISASNSQKYVLKVLATSPSALRSTVRTVFADGTINELRGDTAYVYPDKLAYFTVNPSYKLEEYSYLTHLQVWLKENWVALPVILALASSLLFIALRLILIQYKNRKDALPTGGAATSAP